MEVTNKLIIFANRLGTKNLELMKQVLLLLMMFVSVLANAQTTIKMEKDGGIYKVKCKVNGAPMKMYFDTGATNVSISKATAIYLYDNDLISEDDFIGKIKTATAEGAISDNMLIRLKDVEIGGLHLKDIEAVVTSTLNAPLLLGQSVISKLGKITLDGDMLTIHSINKESLSDEQRAELDGKLEALSSRVDEMETVYQILDIVERIEKSEELNEKELFHKLMAEVAIDKNDEALVDAERWIEKFSSKTNNNDMKMRTFWASAKSNILSKHGNKELGWQHLTRCGDYFKKDSDAHFFWFHFPNLTIEYNLYKNDHFINAIQASKLSICHFLESEKVNLKDINNNKCSYTSPGLNAGFACLESSYHHEFIRVNNMNNSQPNDKQLKILVVCTIMCAKLGNPASIQLCQQNGIDYKRILNKKELELLGLECGY